jgi:hypothetical protein
MSAESHIVIAGHFDCQTRRMGRAYSRNPSFQGRPMAMGFASLYPSYRSIQGRGFMPRSGRRE